MIMVADVMPGLMQFLGGTELSETSRALEMRVITAFLLHAGRMSCLQSALEFLVSSGTAAWSPPVAVAFPTIGVAVVGALWERPRAASTTIGREPKKSSDFCKTVCLLTSEPPCVIEGELITDLTYARRLLSVGAHA